MTKLKSPIRSGEEGSALLIVLLASSLLAGLGLALAGLGSVESLIASNHRAAGQLGLAADAGVEAVIAELSAVANWSDIVGGVVTSRLAGHAVPPVAPGSPSLTLAQLTASMQTDYSRLGSWGADTPQWRLFGHGWLSELVPVATGDSDEFLAMFVADDVGEHDGAPFIDANGRIQIAARASNARGGHRTMLVTVEKIGAPMSPGVRVLSWREMQ